MWNKHIVQNITRLLTCQSSKVVIRLIMPFRCFDFGVLPLHTQVHRHVRLGHQNGTVEIITVVKPVIFPAVTSQNACCGKARRLAEADWLLRLPCTDANCKQLVTGRWGGHMMRWLSTDGWQAGEEWHVESGLVRGWWDSSDRVESEEVRGKSQLTDSHEYVGTPLDTIKVCVLLIKSIATC